MKLIADEHIPPAFVSALRGEGHDVAVIGDDIQLGAADSTVISYARDSNRVILSEDSDLQGADPDLDIESVPGILACDTSASPGRVAAAIRRIETYSVDLSGTVLFVPGEWV